MAEIAEVLWRRFLRHNPANPAWADRDRFVLSNGHGSMLQYALLHLAGYAVSMDDIKAFRQMHSKTPGHPEYGMTPGVETTNGPLGQGLANAVGKAIAEMVLARTFNRPGHQIVDHATWVFLGDGCLMEGISHEVCSLAGTLGLGKLTCFWDDNGISIDGHVGGWFTDDTPKRFEAYGWHVVRDVNGHDPEVLVGNEVRHGAVRTLLQGSIQPSELAKLITLIYLAVWLYAKRERLSNISFGLLPLALILGLLGGLIFIQPDLSAVFTIFILGGMMFFLAGGDLKQIAILLVVALLIGWVVVQVTPTGASRVQNYLAGLEDPSQASYHVRRSIEAFVNGEWFGVGIGNGVTKVVGLPVPPRDRFTP